MYNTNHFKPKRFSRNLTGTSKKKLQRNKCKTELWKILKWYLFLFLVDFTEIIIMNVIIPTYSTYIQYYTANICC